MQLQYSTLFKVRLLHDFFPADSYPAIAVVPTPDTAYTMQRLGIRLVDRNDGVELFYSHGSAQPSLLSSAGGTVRLTFLLRPGDPLFYNYSDLPTGIGSGKLCYLTNLSPQTGQPAGVFQTRTSDTYPVYTPVFDLTVPAGQSLALYDELGNEVATYPASGDSDASIAPLNEDGSKIQLDLSRLPPALYTLYGDEEVLLQFITNPPNRKAEDAGILAVYLGDTGVNSQHILVDGTVTPSTFELQYTARNTIWRYYLIDQGNMGFGEFQLIDHASRRPLAPPANPPLTVPLPDHSKAVILTSGSAIPLRQRPGQRFQLRMTSTSSGRSAPIDLNLPSADAARISRDESPPTDASEAPAFYSDMYVYL